MCFIDFYCVVFKVLEYPLSLSYAWNKAELRSKDVSIENPKQQGFF